MPLYNPVQRTPQRPSIQRPRQSESPRNVIDAVHPFQLRQKPQPLLRER